MAKLSELITTAKFETTLPVLKQKIQYRPFLVKEQKALLQAQVDENVETAINTVKSVLTNCTFEKVNIEKLTSTDIEWLMLQIRAKSVGEDINMNLTCAACNNTQPHSVTINDIKITEAKTGITNPIKLETGLYVEVELPGLTQAMAMGDKDSTEVVAKCIKSIIHGDEIISSENVSLSELVDFVESMTNDMLTKIIEYIDSTPKLYIQIDTVCTKCGAPIVAEVKGVMDFLG